MIIDDSGGTSGAPHFFTAPDIVDGSDVQYTVVDGDVITETSTTTTTEHGDNVVLVYHSMADGTTPNGNSMTLHEEEDGTATGTYPDPNGSLLPEELHPASCDNSGDVSGTEAQQPLYLGRLAHKDQILLIQEPCIDIGRNSTKSNVHFHVSKNSFISRKHLQLTFQPSTGDFYLICLSKNGIFVDKSFFRNLHEPIKLQKS